MTIVRSLLLLVALGLCVLGWGYATALRDPAVREARIALAGWPEGAPPVRALLISDLHVAGPDMPPERLARIVTQINEHRPDVVLIAGDFVSDKTISTRAYPFSAAITPLAGLRAPLGIFAVLGNHDHWRDATEARRTVAAVGIRLLDNEAVGAGPLAIGGLDDAFTGHDDMPAMVARLRTVPGARVVLSHSPDPFPDLPPDIGLMLAGHTHCGQIRLPLIGPIVTFSRYGDRYACGLVREGGRSLVVGAGIGTSILPLRLGAAPDMWLVTLGPAGSPAP